MRVAVIGAGSWGTALALVLAEAGHEVVLWARTPEWARAINEEHRNPRYLSDYRLPSAIRATAEYAAACDGAEAVVIVTPSAALRSVAADLRELVAPAEHRNPRYLSDYRLPSAIRATAEYACACEGAEAVVIVTPSAALRSVAADLRELIAPKVPIVICSKGVEEKMGLLPIDTFAAELGGAGRMAVLSGPTHAEEVICRKPSAAVVASADEGTALFFRDLFATRFFRTYTSDDPVGVELCAAFKNVIAIAVGISYGMGFGDNTAAMLITRGLAEMSRMVVAAGGEAITCMGLGGAGDMVVTCMSQHSRNRRFGERYVARGLTLDDFTAQTHMVVEGAIACKTLATLEARYGVDLPLTDTVRAASSGRGELRRGRDRLPIGL